MASSKVIGQKTGETYQERRAVRVIVTKAKGEIVILQASKDDYFKVPGGSIEYDEDHRVACEREVMEETGCKIEVDEELIATAEEWRGDLHQISFCYAAKLLEDTGGLALTEKEVACGLKHEWVAIEKVVAEMNGAKPTSELGKFIKERDVFFVEAYLKKCGQISH